MTEYLLIGFTDKKTSTKIRKEAINLLKKGIYFICVSDTLEGMKSNIEFELEDKKDVEKS